MATTKKKKAPVANTDINFNLKDLAFMCLARWYWFVISIAICLGFTYYQLLKTTPVYTRTASVLIKGTSQGVSQGGVEEAFQDFGMFNTTVNMTNELITLRSKNLMEEVVKRLKLDMNYSVDGRFHPDVLYGTNLPVEVILPDVTADQSASMRLNLASDGTYSLTDLTLDGAPKKDIKGHLADTIQSDLGRIIVLPSKHYDNASAEINVWKTPMKNAVAAYNGALGVTQDNEKGSIIILNINDISTQRAEDILNAVISVYNENWVKDKNQIAISTSMFINDRLGIIENELGNVDDDISSYKSEHLITDVSATAGMYMAQASQAQQAINDLNTQVYMARYVRNYLENTANKFELLPVNPGMSNLNISGQIGEYNNKLMERNSLVTHASEDNPLVQEMDKDLDGLRRAMLTSIDNELVALEAQIKNYQSMSGKANTQIASNPQQAKYLLSVERQQKVKEELYLYLLQKREENELSQAFTAYNTRIVEYPDGSRFPTFPQKGKTMLLALAVGIAIPLGIIIILALMNTVVRGRKDIESLTIPYIGEIPLAYVKKTGRFGGRKKLNEKTAVVVKEKSRNEINEAFRMVRTNLEFMIDNEDRHPVIALTSANPNSGKTFISYNLAASFAIKDKKVIVIDLDLRKASLSRYIGSPKVGVADYLAGKVDKAFYASASENGGIPNLDIMPVGTVPPNPAELLFSKRLPALLERLRKDYDYIFLDCPPIEMVADASIINKYADMTLFVIRAGVFERAMLPDIEKMYEDGKLKNMTLVLNGTDAGSGRYGYKYGYRYGYKYGYHGGHYGYTTND